MNYEIMLQDVFMIRKLLVVQHEQCLPVFEMDLNSHVNLDPSLICDVLQTQDPTQVEKISSTADITKIKYYGFIVLTTSYGSYTAYLFTEQDLQSDLEKSIVELVKWFDLVFGFDSSEGEYSEEFSDYYKISIMDKITHLFHLWLLYPLEIDIRKLAEIESESVILRDILTHFAENKQTSIMRLLDDLQKYPVNETLGLLFKLVEKEFVITSISDQYTQTFFELDRNKV
ncbi:MAG: hypothetical protein GPJ51_06860 [Candidatus Heimdallarchaeota archaeon]|nr:hypothetical protein [Candidatus Heimdallarchaeota archaeon]